MIYGAFSGREVSAQAVAVETLSFLLASNLEGFFQNSGELRVSTLSVGSLLGGAAFFQTLTWNRPGFISGGRGGQKVSVL